METYAAIAELQGRLRTYDAERFPVQHATAQFHLGVVLLQSGRAGEAADALRTAVELFAPLPVEQAKARNMLGAALRESGRPQDAITAFSDAADTFAKHDLPSENGAARHNLGLVHAGAGRPDLARTCFSEAWEKFEAARLPAQAAAAARELGAAHLAAGDETAAIDVLEQAVDLADRAADHPGRGAAANVLGLARLAAGDTDGAVAAFETAAGGYPRRIRPEGYAMVKANLALAFERAGAASHAALAARQALGVPSAADAVREQAGALLDRLPPGSGVLVEVLDEEPPEHWPRVLREELERWLDAAPSERQAATREWVDGLLRRDGRAPDLIYAWLAILLEAPPDEMETAVGNVLDVLGERDADARRRFREHTSRAFIRFRGPQWLRLKDTFNRLARARGEEPAWH